MRQTLPAVLGIARQSGPTAFHKLPISLLDFVGNFDFAVDNLRSGLVGQSMFGFLPYHLVTASG